MDPSYFVNEARKTLQEKSRLIKWNYTVGSALAVVQIDHTVADILLVEPHNRSVVGRPTLTLAIDVATRCVLGFCASLEAPSSLLVALCLEVAVFPKTDAAADWPMYGLMKSIHSDNGREFHGQAFLPGMRSERHRYDLQASRNAEIRRPHRATHWHFYAQDALAAWQYILGHAGAPTKVGGVTGCTNPRRLPLILDGRRSSDTTTELTGRLERPQDRPGSPRGDGAGEWRLRSLLYRESGFWPISYLYEVGSSHARASKLTDSDFHMSASNLTSTLPLSA